MRTAIECLPENDDPITRRLAEARILAPPPDDARLSEADADRLEQEL